MNCTLGLDRRINTALLDIFLYPKIDAIPNSTPQRIQEERKTPVMADENQAKLPYQRRHSPANWYWWWGCDRSQRCRRPPPRPAGSSTRPDDRSGWRGPDWPAVLDTPIKQSTKHIPFSNTMSKLMLNIFLIVCVALRCIERAPRYHSFFEDVN